MVVNSDGTITEQLPVVNTPLNIYYYTDIVPIRSPTTETNINLLFIMTGTRG